MLFSQILKEMHLLQEDYSEEDIKNAIENCIPVSIVYNDKKGGGGKSWRYIYPIAYGQMNNGRYALRAFQPKGSTKRGNGKWKLFIVDPTRLRSFNLLNTGENKNASFNPKELEGIRFDGDKQITHMIYNAPCINVEPIIDNEPITKSDIEGEKPSIAPATTTTTGGKQLGYNYTYNTEWGKNWANQYDNSRTITLDNAGKISYNNINNTQTIDAPPTKPITKTDVQPEDDNKKSENDMPPVDNKPVTKDDIEEPKEVENDITPKFNDMMNRWDNLNKDEEEKK